MGAEIRPLNFKKRNLHKMEYDEDKMEDANMSENNYVTKEQLSNLEKTIDLKIKVAVLPLEGKIDNLPTQFENIILKEREYQDSKTKETRRYLWGTIGVGIVSIVVSVILNFV